MITNEYGLVECRQIEDLPKQEVCKWIYHKQIQAYVDGCGEVGGLSFDEIEVDSWKYCPYCGKPIEVSNE